MIATKVERLGFGNWVAEVWDTRNPTVHDFHFRFTKGAAERAEKKFGARARYTTKRFRETVDRRDRVPKA